MYTSYCIFIVVFFGNSKELENEFILEEKKLWGIFSHVQMSV